VVEILKTIGLNVKKARKARGLNQEELGDKTGLGKATINRIETGNDFYMSSLLIIAKVLKIDLVDLIKDKTHYIGDKVLSLRDPRGKYKIIIPEDILTFFASEKIPSHEKEMFGHLFKERVKKLREGK
jgi:transcriptional regulator with XRE-family HTH domain